MYKDMASNKISHKWQHYSTVTLDKLTVMNYLEEQSSLASNNHTLYTAQSLCIP